jgi:hypothetical protein
VDKFPEAFKRFEKDVDVSEIKSFRQLKMEIASWMGEKWKDTSAQNRALNREAQKLGIPVAYVERREIAYVPSMLWRHETVMVRGKSQARYRDLKSGRFIRRP